MTERIKYPLLFMIFCVAGVIIAQGYWLFKDYKYYSGQPLFSTDQDFFIKIPNTTKPPVILKPVQSPTLDRRNMLKNARRGIAIPIGRVQMQNTRGTTVMHPDSIPGFKVVSYTAPVSYIIEKMKLQFGISFLLIVCTTTCFIYMLLMIIRQKKASIAKNDFINDMTHELKTPLATVSVVIESFKHYDGYEDKDKKALYLDISRKEIDHLSRLVELILQQAIFDSQVMVLSLKVTDINQLLDQIKNKYSLSDALFTLTVDCQSDMPSILIDSVHMNNVIRNLVDNAIKYSTVNKTIKITSGIINKKWRLTIADNGIGIPKIYQANIFDRFFRVPHTKESIKGFGLGLTYVKQVVSLHHGTVSLESEQGKGSTFTINIPIK